MSGHWVYAALGLMLVLHGIALLFAYHNSRQRASPRGQGEEFLTGEGVECPECGAINDQPYRYCRRCVSELPGKVSVLGQSRTAPERQPP